MSFSSITCLGLFFCYVMWQDSGVKTWRLQNSHLSKVGHQHTELEHTPKRNLYQQAIWRESFHNWRCRGIAWGVPWVCCNFLEIWCFSQIGAICSFAVQRRPSLKECRISGASPFHIRILNVRQAKKNKQVKRLTVRSTSHPGFQSPPGWHDIFRFRNP